MIVTGINPVDVLHTGTHCGPAGSGAPLVAGAQGEQVLESDVDVETVVEGGSVVTTVDVDVA